MSQPSAREAAFMDDIIIDDKDDASGTAVARAQQLKQGEEEIGILTRPLRA